ncbi:c-type cytochrome [Rufibacter roseus]|uniref:C-type cytochrome n=1 Tax=Rufibacter roseus TaxID=1567108 RepID=A0ABW2DLG7_9BACT|nr:cytochrome c [Rufibacter roseus]
MNKQSLLQINLTLVIWCMGVLLLQSCGSARRSEPIIGPLALQSQQLENGRQVFMLNCQKCHPAGEAGLGPPINNVPLPGAALRFRVRSRAFALGIGRMPSFKEHEISDEQLDDLVKYMKALRRHKTKPVASAKRLFPFLA